MLIGAFHPIAFQQSRKKFLREVLRVFWRTSAPSHISIQRIPVSDAKLFEGSTHLRAIAAHNQGIAGDNQARAVVRYRKVHLRGHFLLARNAAKHWRDKSKMDGKPVYGRLVTTASEAWLVGSPGQPNYAAAKAGIAALTVSAARGLHKYGVRANAICPRARTAMTESVFGAPPAEGADALSVDHVAPFVAFLASPAAERINGQVFVVHGGMVALLAPPQVEQRFDTRNTFWTPEELETHVGGYFAGREPERMFANLEILKLGGES